MVAITYDTSAPHVVRGVFDTLTSAQAAAGTGESSRALSDAEQTAAPAGLDANGQWAMTETAGVASFAAPTYSAVQQLVHKLHEFYDHFERIGADLAQLSPRYPESVVTIAHEGHAWVYSGVQIVLMRWAPSVEFLTTAQRDSFLDGMIAGLSDATTAEEFLDLLLTGTLGGATLRTPAAPLVYADPRTTPATRVAVLNAIDLSAAAGYTDSDGGTVAGLAFTSQQARDTCVTREWFDDITGDLPDAPVAAATAPDIPDGQTVTTVTLNWTAPSGNGYDITGYQVQHHDGDGAPTDAILTLGANSTSHGFAGVLAGTHTFRVRASNSEGYGPWAEAEVTVAAAGA